MKKSSLPKIDREEPVQSFADEWRDRIPTANDLSHLFRITPRQVRQLWADGKLTKGGDIRRAISEWIEHRSAIVREGRGGQRPGGGGHG